MAQPIQDLKTITPDVQSAAEAEPDSNLEALDHLYKIEQELRQCFKE
jgi:hypothetical protein